MLPLSVIHHPPLDDQPHLLLDGGSQFDDGFNHGVHNRGSFDVGVPVNILQIELPYLYRVEAGSKTPVSYII